MVGKFGGAAFVLFYLLMVFVVGIPALMAEWTLGRYTGKGTVGAFERGGLPGGRYFGYFLFCILLCAISYYTTLVGWVGFFAVGQILSLFSNFDAAIILPPDEGFNAASYTMQLVITPSVIILCGIVIVRGLRKGIERVSSIIMPALFVILIILIIRSVTLENAGAGIAWFLGKFELKALTGSVMAAALGQAVFSMSLGGTFMVIYGSYLDRRTNILGNAFLIGCADSIAGLLAGLAIFPAVFALGLEPDSGPSLIFHTLPETFARMPAGRLFGLLFFVGLFGAAFLSAVGAYEVLTGGLVDNSRISRKKAVILVCGISLVISTIPMINMKIFIPWDLTFGAGMQTLGAFFAVITTAWCIKRSNALKELAYGAGKPFPVWLYWWMRFVIPLAILLAGS